MASPSGLKGQTVELQPDRQGHRDPAYFDAEAYNGYPFLDACPTRKIKHNPKSLPFSHREVNPALRCKGSTEMRDTGQNRRAGAESLLRSVHRPGTGKHPFPNGKLPVRGKFRMSMMVIASGAMTIIQYIQGYQEKLREEKRKAREIQRHVQEDRA